MRRNVALSVCCLIYLPFALEFFVSRRLLPSLPTLASLPSLPSRFSRLFTFNSFNCTCLSVCSCRCFCCYSYCCWKLQLTLDGRRLLPLSSLAKLPWLVLLSLSLSFSLSPSFTFYSLPCLFLLNDLKIDACLIVTQSTLQSNSQVTSAF